MKLKKEFILREIAGEYLLVPTGKTTLEFNGLITINELGAFIWNNINQVDSEGELLNRILNEYDVEESVAKKDLDEFLGKLKESEII